MVFTLIFYFCAIPVYNSYLMLGYTTYYTFWPVFCLVFDQDLDESSALAFPKLYESLQKGRSFSLKTFLVWTTISLYQVCFVILCGLCVRDRLLCLERSFSLRILLLILLLSLSVL